jgi:hypothetical protein
LIDIPTGKTVREFIEQIAPSLLIDNVIVMRRSSFFMFFNYWFLFLFLSQQIIFFSDENIGSEAL